MKDVYLNRLAAVVLGVAFAFALVSQGARAALTSESKLGTTGVGPIVFGMTPSQALATGTKLSSGKPAPGSTCYQMRPDMPSGLSFLVEEGNVRRADVEAASIASTDGFRVGDPLAKVVDFYGTRVTVTPAKYDPAGKTVTVAPKAGADDKSRFVFEVKDGKIHRMISGLMPQVSYVEGCG